MDIFARCFTYRDPDVIQAAGIYPYFQPLTSSDGPVVRIDGREIVMMGSNNYLGLTHHPRVKKAAHDAIDRYGTGCTGSRFLNGNLDLHEDLEAALAAFVGKESALVFSSGFLANAGAIAALGEGDDAVLLSERDNHGSIIDGTRLAHAGVRVYDTLDELEALLAKGNGWENALVVTDAVFSMTGRVADLGRLAGLKRRHGFRLYVDDAHGLGVLGPGGRGTCHEQGIQDDVDVLFGTFSKALASLGGFVAGEARVIKFLRHRSRSLVFSAALPPASAAAALAALHVLQDEPDLLTRLWDNVAYFRDGLHAIGYHTLGSRMPIQPLFIGSETLAMLMCTELLELGVFATPVAFPAVPFGQALIRTSTNPAHTRAHLDRALEAFAELARRHPTPPVDPGHLPVASGIDFSYALARLQRDG